MSLNTGSVFRFGEFELHPASRTVLRGEEKLTLNRRAFDVLFVLVQHPGEVLSREQLLKSIWSDSFVDENSLSQSISTLRRALAEKPGENNYIATLPGRGYQFLLPVSELRPSQSQLASYNGKGLLMQEHTISTTVVVEEVSQQARTALGKLISRTPVTATITAALAVTLAGAMWWRQQSIMQPSAYRHIVLADFVNATGDSTFDLTLRKALEIDLAQSPYMDVLSAHGAAETLRFMGRPADTPLTVEVAREICERTNNDVLLNGTVSAIGRNYLLTVEATGCTTGKTLAVAKAKARTREEVLDALDTVATELRRGLNESTRSMQEHEVPLREATTSSLEALKAYSVARLLTDEGRPHSERIAAYQRAIDLDPQFALAYRGLMTENTYIGQDALAAQYSLRAFNLSQHVSTREKLLIQASYYQFAQRDILAAIKAWKLLAATYPQDPTGVINGMDAYMQLGQHASALEEGLQGLSRFPNAVVIYENLATNYLSLNRFADALDVTRKADQIGMGDTGSHVHLFLIALARHDAVALASETRWFDSQENGTTVWYFPSLRGTAEATAGKLAAAEPLFQRAYESALRAGAAEAADRVLLDKAETELELGLKERAGATLRRITQPENHELDVLLLQTELGDTGPSKRFLAAQGQPTADTLRTNVFVPELRAAVALHDREPQRAVDALVQSTPYEMRDYVVLTMRAGAYLQANRPDEAAAEYAKILANPGVDPLSVLYPLAHLGLARAYEMQGRYDASRSEYQSLLTQWKNADADLPVLKVAEAEKARIPLQ